LKTQGELTVDEAKIWAKVALEMLTKIRADVRSHLPDVHFADISVENFKSHLPELPDVANLNEMRSKLPDIDNVRSKLPVFSLAEISTRLDDVRARFSDLDFKPLHYIPTLSNHLRSLHVHLSSMELPSGINVPSLSQHSKLSDLLDALLSSEFIAELKSEVDEAEDMLERAAQEVKDAVRRSFHGSRLIQYYDLPHKWRNNPFVTRGYR
jgi:adiponectin receptor